MTALQFCEFVVDNRWTVSRTGRNNDVPKPSFVRESPEGFRKVNLDQQDYIIFRDGGVTQVEPQSFNWQEERQLSRVTLDIRTTGEAGSVAGRERLWGERDANNDAPEYGGLTGEVKRIFEEIRGRHKEFDVIPVEEMNDLSGQMGGQIWRATVTVHLDKRAVQLNP